MYIRNEYKQIGRQVCLDSWTDAKLVWYPPSFTSSSFPRLHTVSRKLGEGKVLVLLQNRIQFIFDITEISLAVLYKNKNSITIKPFTLRTLFLQNMHKTFIDVVVVIQNEKMSECLSVSEKLNKTLVPMLWFDSFNVVNSHQNSKWSLIPEWILSVGNPLKRWCLVGGDHAVIVTTVRRDNCKLALQDWVRFWGAGLGTKRTNYQNINLVFRSHTLLLTSDLSLVYTTNTWCHLPHCDVPRDSLPVVGV